MVRMATNNPFEPGSDRIPEVWAGRREQLADWRDRLLPRRSAGQYERGRTLLGEPGIGKSVLVGRIVRDAVARGEAWATTQIRIPRGAGPLPLIAHHLLALADEAGLPAGREDRLGSLLDRVRSLSLAGSGLTLEPPEGLPAHVALTGLLIEIARAAASQGRVAIVHVDEVQNIDDDDQMSQVLVALGDALAHEEPREVPGGSIEASLPLVVFLTGLPEFADHASSRVGATFARRFATDLLEPISDDDLHAALRPFVHSGRTVHVDGRDHRVHMAPEAADRIVDLCHGDPFLFQLAGQHAWDASTAPIISVDHVEAGWRRARHEARMHVERQLDRLPDKERAAIEAMAALAPDERTATRIAREMGYDTAAQIGPTTQRLDTIRGLISRGRRYTFRVRTVEAHLTSPWPDLPG